MLTLKSAWSDEAISILLNRMEIMERLVALILPSMANQILYHGIFASRSKYPRKILPMYRQKKVSKPEALRMKRK